MNAFEIGNFIRQLRIERHYTQRRLGEALDISYKEIQKWEDGQSVPSDEMFQELSELFQVTIGELRQGHKDIEVNPIEEMAKNVVLSILLYTGLIIVLLGISLFLFATRVFVIHIIFILFSIVFLRFVIFRLQPQKRIKQYFLVVLVLVVISGLFMIFDSARIFVKDEERLVINEYKEHLYLGELGYGTDVVIFYTPPSTMMAIVYREEREDYAIVPLTYFQSEDIIEVDTEGDLVIDVVRYQDKLYITTIQDYYGPYTIYEMDTTTFEQTQIYQSDKIFKLYASWSGMYLWEHPIFLNGDDETDIYYFDNLLNPVYLTTINHMVWDMIEYDWEHTTKTLLSTTSGVIENSLMLNQVILYDNSFMESGDVVISGLEDPLWFDKEWKKAFAYNEDVIYTFVEDDVKEVRGIDGFYDFNVIHEGLYFGDYKFYDENFNVIQESHFYDENYNLYDVGAEVFSDENMNMYTLDNEFMGFAVQYRDEPYFWTLPLQYRVTYMVFSTVSLGFVIQAGQKVYQQKKQKKQDEMEA